MSVSESNYPAWLAEAENDLLNIQNNLAADHIPWDTICFLAQQAAEKLLKAFLVYHGRTFLRTHDLIALLAICVEIDASLTGLEDDCRRLTHYAVGSRYPDDLYEPDESDASGMVAAAYRVRSEILARLP
ncbi:MAG: HEPN domain-containing protein [Acidobacteria bacterium]|nr:HEPN domain-containing protein [Acidobacteriota bacterium]